jgi:hypothetical protein
MPNTYRGLLERIEDEWETRPTHLADVDNVRAALEWCFGVNGDLEIAVGLAAAAAPVFLVLSLVPECHRWHLQASLGVSSMQMYGQGDAGRVALNRSLAIAEARGDALNQVGLPGMRRCSIPATEISRPRCITQSSAEQPRAP